MKDVKIYLTVLSSDEYFNGVLVLYKSLLKTNPKYPFYVAITNNISENIQQELKRYKLKIIKLSKTISLPKNIEENNKQNGYEQWNNTLDKLKIFELTQFTKIVYLDSDMMINNNIDELFEKKHMSAVVAGALIPENSDWKLLNSGIMVIEPKKQLGKKIGSKINEVLKKKKYLGDQDLIQEYYNEWPLMNLQLNHKYNTFIYDVDYYCKRCKYNLKLFNKEEMTISVIHFVGKLKPWMISRNYKIKLILSCIKNRKINMLKAYLFYFIYLNKINKERKRMELR